MTEGGEERRGSGRAPAELPIEYDRLNAFLSDYTQNISRGGTFIRTEQPLAVGGRLVFRIRAPELGELWLDGIVRWVTSPDQATAESPAGMGIEFVFASAENRRDIELRLDRLLAGSLGSRAYSHLMGRPPPEDD